MILPFRGTLIDRIYAESESCPVKAAFTEYVDVMNKVCVHKEQGKWE